ncbi:uncharacterized protein LOC126570907 [Anopheles aquasalis]|uniref:uncharacterized protein LOC126570907 n=1 Tax=Anopheles aquasalis TaxID=42839 RepID=UPI00215A29F3|nr:uncharacterized protein LOC126570907 [Anopheles aquasalis]
MKIVPVSVLLSVFHISSLNAGKLYYPNPPTIDDVPVQPQYIPPSDIYITSEATIYPQPENLQWIPVENIPPSFSDESAYYYYPNHKHIGSTIPCPNKGHTTKKPYIAPKVTTTTTTTTTPRPIHHKVHTKGSAVGIKTSFNELELKLNQLKLALSKFARAEGLEYDVEDGARTLPVSSETNEDSKVEGKGEVVEEQPKQEMEEQSKSEMQITQDVGQDEAIVQEADMTRSDLEDSKAKSLLEVVTEQTIENTSTHQEANADQKTNVDLEETEINLSSKQQEEVTPNNVVPWFEGLNQDPLRDLPLDDGHQDEVIAANEHREEVRPGHVVPWFNGLNQNPLRDRPLGHRLHGANVNLPEMGIHSLPSQLEEVSPENVSSWFNGLDQDLLRYLPSNDGYFQNGYQVLTS